MLEDLNTNERLLNYLMTSDYEEGLSYSDFKHLLLSFRKFYRNISAKNDSLIVEIAKKNQDIINNILIYTSEVDKLNIEKANLENELHFINKSRKLTWKERLTGKINYKIK